MPFTLLGAPPELGVSSEPIAWMDWILLITQTGVIVAAVFAPLLAHKLAQRRAERERDLKNRNTQSAIRAELLYLVAFYDEIWGSGTKQAGTQIIFYQRHQLTCLRFFLLHKSGPRIFQLTTVTD